MQDVIYCTLLIYGYVTGTGTGTGTVPVRTGTSTVYTGIDTYRYVLRTVQYKQYRYTVLVQYLF